MAAWIVGLGYKATSTPDAPSVPSAARTQYTPRTSPTSWSTRWRTVGLLRLRPAWAL